MSNHKNDGFISTTKSIHRNVSIKIISAYLHWQNVQELCFLLLLEKSFFVTIDI